MIDFFVHGLPVAQPRTRATAFRGKARVYDPGTANAWKACVIAAVRALEMNTMTGPVCLRLEFFLPRPKSHYGKRGLLPSAPAAPTCKPDLDNLEKALMDAMTSAGAWIDDAQVIAVNKAKSYAPGPALTGCRVIIE